jgi:hypothetical protein
MPVGAPVFSPGFRFSRLDAIVLFVGLSIAANVAAVHRWPGIGIGFVVAHFFIFCNAVRMERPAELTWAAIFVLLAASTILTGAPTWPVMLAVSFAVAVVLIALETRKPSYHGVFWRHINPGLPQWWHEQLKGEALAKDSVPN